MFQLWFWFKARWEHHFETSECEKVSCARFQWNSTEKIELSKREQGSDQLRVCIRSRGQIEDKSGEKPRRNKSWVEFLGRIYV